RIVMSTHNKYFVTEKLQTPDGWDVPGTDVAINNVYLNGVRIASMDANGQTAYYLANHVDSVKIVADDTGKAVSRTEYLPYGETFQQEGDIKFTPKYNGQALDNESDLYYFNARHYDPEIGRFVTADAVTDGHKVDKEGNVIDSTMTAWNRYMYVRGNPVMYKDPTGHAKVVMFTGFNNTTDPILNYNDKDTGTVKTKDQLMKRIKDEGLEEKVDVEVIGTSINKEKNAEAALKFILKDYKKGEKIIIYGYSMGSDSALLLAKKLKENNIDVDKLIIIDAENKSFRTGNTNIAETKVPENVNDVTNWYQRAENDPEQGGAILEKTTENQKTRIKNQRIYQTDHGNIDESMKDRAVNTIMNQIYKETK
ncbi:MAG: RHS repeat-associated core domain-containing protein, partial [Leptospirales bacterium]